MNPKRIASLITEDPDVFDNLDDALNVIDDDLADERDEEYTGLDENLDLSLNGPNLQSSAETPSDTGLLDFDDGRELDGLEDEGLKDDLAARKEIENSVRDEFKQEVEPQLHGLTDVVGDIDDDADKGMQHINHGRDMLGNLDDNLDTVTDLLSALDSSLI